MGTGGKQHELFLRAWHGRSHTAPLPYTQLISSIYTYETNKTMFASDGTDASAAFCDLAIGCTINIITCSYLDLSVLVGLMVSLVLLVCWFCWCAVVLRWLRLVSLPHRIGLADCLSFPIHDRCHFVWFANGLWGWGRTKRSAQWAMASVAVGLCSAGCFFGCWPQHNKYMYSFNCNRLVKRCTRYKRWVLCGDIYKKNYVRIRRTSLPLKWLSLTILGFSLVSADRNSVKRTGWMLLSRKKAKTILWTRRNAQHTK